jgi:hypothetical protein
MIKITKLPFTFFLKKKIHLKFYKKVRGIKSHFITFNVLNLTEGVHCIKLKVHDGEIESS